MEYFGGQLCFGLYQPSSQDPLSLFLFLEVLSGSWPSGMPTSTLDSPFCKSSHSYSLFFERRRLHQGRYLSASPPCI